MHTILLAMTQGNVLLSADVAPATVVFADAKTGDLNAVMAHLVHLVSALETM